MKTKFAGFLKRAAALVFLAGICLSPALLPTVQAAPAGETFSGLAYLPVTNEYMAVFARYDSGNIETQVFGQRLTAEGAATGDEFPLSEIFATSSFYDVGLAWDPIGNRGLVVWHVWDGGSNLPVYGQFFEADGTLLTPVTLAPVGDFSGKFTISDATTYSFYHGGVAFDLVNRRYLVVWADSNTTDIHGRVIEADGTLPGTTFLISTAANQQYMPKAAADQLNGRFLVVWRDSRNSPKSDIYGQLVDADGNLLTPGTLATGADSTVNLRITEDLANPLRDEASVAYSASGQVFLVAWRDARDTDYNIYGQRVSPAAVLQGANTLFSDDGTDSERQPGVSHDPVAGKFRAAFVEDDTDIASNNILYLQNVADDGTKDGANLQVHADAVTPITPSYNSPPTTIQANPLCANSLVAVSKGSPLVVTYFEAGGACAPDPGLLWPSGGTPAGSPYTGGSVSPTTATVGDTVTFTVDYYSASNTAPTQAYLLIDLNGDETYEPLAGGVTRPSPTGGQGGGPAPWVYGLAALLLAWLGASVIARRHPGLRGAATIALVLLLGGVLTLAAVPGCTSSSSDNGGGEETTGETIVMSEADAADTTYTDGKRYTVDVTVEAAGTLTYLFAFSDGTSVAVGHPALPQTLTVSE